MRTFAKFKSQENDFRDLDGNQTHNLLMTDETF